MTIGVPTVQQDNLHRASGTVEGWEIGESSDGPWDRGDVGSGCSGLAHPGKRMCSADVPAAGWGGENRDRSVGRRHRPARSRDRSSACRGPEGCRFCPREGPTPRPGTPEGPPVLDLTSLEKRLRETQAIGVFTKLSLKHRAKRSGICWRILRSLQTSDSTGEEAMSKRMKDWALIVSNAALVAG